MKNKIENWPTIIAEVMPRSRVACFLTQYIDVVTYIAYVIFHYAAVSCDCLC